MILYLTAPDPDYGADFLHHGFVELLGANQVIDWPIKPSMHGGGTGVFDCEFNLPEHGWTPGEVRARLMDDGFDLVVIPTLRGDLPQWIRQNRELFFNNADRLVYVDNEDGAQQTDIQEVLGFTPRISFKRELPIGATWAAPLPFGYPAARCQDVGDREPRVGYIAEVWEWARSGLREKLAIELVARFGHQAHAVTTYDGQRRLSLQNYHAALAQCSVAVVPAGRGWITNRLLEVIACGCAPVIERPWIQYPEMFIDGEECLMFSNEHEAVDCVAQLLSDPPRAKAMAEAAQAKWLRYHTTHARAATVWKAIYP